MHEAKAGLNPFLPLLLILVIAPFWWLFICHLIARIGGWSYLAKHYRSEKEVAEKACAGRWLKRQSGETNRLGGYRNALSFGVAREGLYLVVMFMFKAGHPPLFIPWDELTMTPVRKYWYFDYIELKFRRAPHVSLFIRPQLHEKLMSLAKNPG